MKKIEICFVNGRKHCGKNRKCLLPAFPPFPTMFSEGFSFGFVKNSGLCGKGLTLLFERDIIFFFGSMMYVCM